MESVSLFLFATMQLACLMAAAFMIYASGAEIIESHYLRRDAELTVHRPSFAVVNILLAVFALTIFWQRLDFLLKYHYPVSSSTLSSMMILYLTMGGSFALLSGKPRRSLTIFSLLLVTSFIATYLEYV